jgi:hypothetical protein
MNSNTKNINMSSMLYALENISKNINQTTTRKATKKSTKSVARKSVKSRKHINAKNSRRTLRDRLRAERLQRLAEKRLKAIRVSSHGVEGLDNLVHKLRKIERFYDASNVEKQSDITVYLSILTTKLQDEMEKNLHEEYSEEYPELFDVELASDDPLSYISHLIELLEDMSDRFDRTNDEDKQILLDIHAEVILEATKDAGNTFESLSVKKKNNALNALANMFGALGF